MTTKGFEPLVHGCPQDWLIARTLYYMLLLGLSARSPCCLLAVSGHGPPERLDGGALLRRCAVDEHRPGIPAGLDPALHPGGWRL